MDPSLQRPSLAVQTIALWTVMLLGTLFHTQLALIPLFHGLTVLAPHGHVAQDIREITAILWLMLAFFAIPLGAIVGNCCFAGRRYRVGHFGLTVLYSGLNLAHLLVDLTIPPVAWYQIALMALLFGVGLVLNWVSYRWMRAGRRPRSQVQAAR